MSKDTTDYNIKKIPNDLYEKVKKRANKNNRSVNKEIINILEESVEVK